MIFYRQTDEMHYVVFGISLLRKHDHLFGRFDIIDLQTFGDGWVNVPMAFKQVKPGSMMLDGRPAPVVSGKVAIEDAGPHRIEVEFEIYIKPLLYL